MSTDNRLSEKLDKKRKNSSTTVNIKGIKQDVKNKKINKPHGHYEFNDQNDSSLSASLAILIGQINNISSRLEKMEANQTLTNQKKKMVAPNRS